MMTVRPLVAVGAVMVLTACASTTAAPTSSAKTAPTSSTGLSKIDHVVVVMQENRSYDSYFAQLHNQGQSASSAEPLGGNPSPTGGPPIRPFLKTTVCEVADLSHSWNGTHQEWNGGQMDGFATANVNRPNPPGSRTLGY